jgi:hypothetical protein
MRRNFARWVLTFFGFGLALGGATAMLRGWDIVQVERGWSLFIGGAAALSGGAVVIALAEVVGRLDRLLAAGSPVVHAQALAAEASAQREPAPQIERRAAPAPRAAPPPPPESRPAASNADESVAHETPAEAQPEAWPAPPAPTAPLAPPAPLRVRREEAQAPEPPAKPQAAPPPAEAGEPREIERYQSGGLTYVMFSDGSVELRSDAGAQRFSSTEELRAVLAPQE